MDAYEKSVDKAVDVVDKVARGANRLYIGCVTILANLFFMAFCLWGVYAAYVSWQLETSGETTTGVVVRLTEQSDANGGCCAYVPVVEFEAGGTTYSFDGDTASDPPEYEINEKVSVLYDPSDPNTAQINKFSERWIMPIILIPAMIFASIILTFFMVRAWRRDETILE
jgi:hypothetical protein